MISTNSVINRPLSYARVSTDDQNLNLQTDALLRFGVQANDILLTKFEGRRPNDRDSKSACRL
ncbi:MAG: recombinase family protein [Planctomycetota bacterium]